MRDKTSIFTAELEAILISLHYIQNSGQNKFIIFSDSLSCLQALQSNKLDNPTVLKVIDLYSLISKDKDVIFCWIPGHVGIPGNERADKAAKSGLNKDIFPFKVPYTDFKPYINKYIRDIWQNEWDQKTGNKLHSVKPTLGVWNDSFRRSRKEEVVLSRIRIGHSKITHSFIFNKGTPPECVPCQRPFTIKHILLDCIDFQPIRERYFSASSMLELFADVSVDRIFGFLKEIHVFDRL